MTYKFAIKINNQIFKIKSDDEFAKAYLSVIEKAKELKIKYPNKDINVISLTIPFKVPNKPNPGRKDTYWCPYCRKWRLYLWNEEMGYWACEICNITTRDYYVRQANGGSDCVPW